MGSLCGYGAAIRTIAQLQEYGQTDVDSSLALSAARISKDLRIPMADSLIYATAKGIRATLYSQDKNFKGLPDVVYLAKRNS